tara:strand:+ start:4389 stop:5282 length:894 start_codon:yes stop_codon:yes gene_type:complete
MKKNQADLYMEAIDKKNLYRDSISTKLQRKTDQLMFNTFITKSMYKVLLSKKPSRIIEIGRGYGMTNVMFCHAIADKGTIYSIDVRGKNDYIVKDLLQKFPVAGKQFENIFINEDSTSIRAAEALKKECKGKIDCIYFDGKINSWSSLKKDLENWIPFLSKNCVMFFTSPIRAHDCITVMIDEMLSNYEVYRFCTNKDIESFPNKITDFQSPCRKNIVGIDKQTMRPFEQIEFENDIPDYAKNVKINLAMYKDDITDDTRNFHFICRLYLHWPGLLQISLGEKGSWDMLLKNNLTRN